MHKNIETALKKLTNPEKAAHSARFFKTGPGEYGEGDQFFGITVPEQRKVAQQFWKTCTLDDVEALLKHPVHECRLTALFILVKLYKKDSEAVYTFYLKHAKRVNNWDLVDSSAHKIVGAYLLDKKDRSILHKLATSKNLWERRISVISTFAFIPKKDFRDSLTIATMLVHDKHDLIHKAVGWMLREIGKIDQATEETFLKKHYKTMPRTMLRYAIERFTPEKRAFYMN